GRVSASPRRRVAASRGGGRRGGATGRVGAGRAAGRGASSTAATTSTWLRESRPSGPFFVSVWCTITASGPSSARIAASAASTVAAVYFFIRTALLTTVKCHEAGRDDVDLGDDL